MSISIKERFESRLGSADRIELRYVSFGTDDEDAARQQIIASAPDQYTLTATAPDGENTVLKRRDDGIALEKRLEDKTYQWIVPYSRVNTDVTATDESTFSFEIATETRLVKQSMETVASYPASAPNFHGSINVTDNGVEGVYLPVPVYRWTETHFLNPDFVDSAYRKTLLTLARGTYNDAPFRGLDAGECQFQGASGRKRGRDGWEMTYHFQGSLNLTDMLVGDITVTEKLGFHYLWVRYLRELDPTSGVDVMKPASVYVERVFEPANYDELGIEDLLPEIDP